jgi:RNA polymerase sigma-70 factor (ECF subfamily)
MSAVITGVSGFGESAEEIGLSPVRALDDANGRVIDELFRLHYRRITSLLARLTGDRAYAEEIAADVFHKLARRPMLLEGRDDQTAWIYRVATNAGFDALRARSRRKKHEQAAVTEQLRSSDHASALEAVLREERRQRVQTVLEALKPRDAQLLLLRSEGLSYRDLAEAAGVPASSVGTMLARAEAEFERRYRARHGEEI